MIITSLLQRTTYSIPASRKTTCLFWRGRTKGPYVTTTTMVEKGRRVSGCETTQRKAKGKLVTVFLVILIVQAKTNSVSKHVRERRGGNQKQNKTK